MKYSKNFFILMAAVLAVLILALFLSRGTEGPRDFKDSIISTQNGESPDPSDQHQALAEPALEQERSSSSSSSSGEVWRTGKPGPVLPVVRGVNRERQFGTPVTRELPEVIENGTPSIMAMIPDDGRQALLPEETDRHTLSARRMVLDTTALERVVNGETNHLLVPTPGNEVLDLKIESIRTRTAQTHSLMGKISGEELSDVNIVYHDGIVHGTVVRYDANQHFEYRILPDGYMMVRELDTASMTDRCAIPGAPQADAEHDCGETCNHADVEAIVVNSPVPDTGPSVEADTSGWTTIDVVVGYGAEARIAQGGVSQMEAHIIAAVDRMTDAFFNSLVTNTEIMLLGTIEDPDYVFPGSSSTDMGSADELGDLANGTDGILDTVSDYSALLGADLTSFVVKDGQDGTAGIAQRPGISSIVSRTSMSSGSLTFAHELGHNFGARHSWGDSGDTTTDTSRFGLRFSGTGGTKYRTIMAYFETYGGSRIPHFANPNVSFDGTPTGLEDGSNQTGNDDIDPVYIPGGFDGSNPNLGARNAEMFLVQSGSNGVVFASNRSSRTALGVTSPAVGVQWAAGSSQTISFTGGDMEYTADIDLYKGGVYQETLANDINAINRYFNWDIPLAQDGGNDYQIRVTLTHTGTSATSFAESGFFVIQGVNDIILESPIGGETWTRNTRKNITWSSSYGGNVKIELKEGAAAPETIIESTPDDGSYEWTIPFDQTLGSDYRIIITSDVAPFDSSQSAENFTIDAPTNNLLVTDLDTDPGFTTSGEFAYGAPGAGNGASSPYTGTNMYDTNLADSSFGSSSLTTYAIDCSNHTNIILDFWAYVFIYDNYTAVFEISTDNSNWVELETLGVGSRINQPWTNYTYDITEYAAGESTVYIRWSMLGSGTQYNGGGLSIDDISITGDFVPADGFSIISPNGGESITTETLNQISWLSDLGGNGRIELLKNGSVHSTIASSTPNDGVFNWLVPDTVPAASDYKIRITSVENGSKVDESDLNFAISAPTGTIFTTNLDTDPGFNTTGDFEYGAPSGDNAASSPYTGTNMYDTDLDGTSFLTSNLTTYAIDCSSRVNVQLEFFMHALLRNVGGESPGSYSCIVEVSNTGTDWGNNPGVSRILFSQTGMNTNWVQYNYDISDIADGQSAVYIRWSLSGSGIAWTGQGLAVDDISITGDFVADPPTYDTWAEGPAPDADSNGDGISNAVAWVLGASNPSETATTLAPTIDNTSDATHLIFTYRRSHLAKNDPNSTVFVEYGSDLTSWTTAVHDNDNIIISETLNHYGAGVDRVQVKVKRSLAVGEKLFTRLKVQVPE